MKLYTKQETIDLFYGKMKNNISNLYKDNCINWSGRTKDTKEFYSEIIAQELLLNLEELNVINILTRLSSYKIEGHAKVMIDHSTSTRAEENFAKRLYGLNFDKLGEIIDYQVPLKNKSGDEGIGKIDLISYYDTEQYLYLIELKFGDNKETLLRAILESYTYFKIIDQDKLISDHSSHKLIANQNKKIKCLPAVMIVSAKTTNKQCNSFTELNEMKKGERPMLKSLAKKLNIEFFGCELNAIFTNDYLK
jgi:hypothetical protein